ncbi:hypothetical protein BD769DRAFT_1392764 [Suillus cothurnatus]|nr:hypothetical protein BD769DRAFT_1392764 [Suillus cothurnatus]
MSQLDLNSTFGALYIGGTIGAILFGLSNVQAFLYFQSRKDSGFTFYKLVASPMLLDVFHVCLVNHLIYYYLITNYANPPALVRMVWSFKALIVVDVFIVYSVHILYLQRIWIISKGRTRVLPVVMVLASVNPALGCIQVPVVFRPGQYSVVHLPEFKHDDSDRLSHRLFIVLPPYLCQDRNGHNSSDARKRHYQHRMLDEDAAMPNSFVFLGIEFLLSKLYVNSYMALLNARHYLGSDGSSYSSQIRPPHVYRPDVHVNTSHELQDTPRVSKVDRFQTSDSALEHSTFYPPAVTGYAHPTAVIV